MLSAAAIICYFEFMLKVFLNKSIKISSLTFLLRIMINFKAYKIKPFSYKFVGVPT